MGNTMRPETSKWILDAAEEALGVQLFRRTNHVVELTRAGVVAVKTFEKIV